MVMTPRSANLINSLQIRMLKTDRSPVKKRLAEACRNGTEVFGFDVWLHIYDLGQVSKWLLNSWQSPSSGLSAFHCGLEVLGVEWTFQAMVDCETDSMTGLMCHSPKKHPRHIYRESVCLGSSPLCANDICKVLARLERDWPTKSYHFLSRNCTDFAEALAKDLGAPAPFPLWAHGIAKGVHAKAPWWVPNTLVSCANTFGSCGSASDCCTSEETSNGGRVTQGENPTCDELLA